MAGQEVGPTPVCLSPPHPSLPPVSQQPGEGALREHVAAARPPVPALSLMELGGPLTLASPGTGFCELVRTPGAQICLSLFLSLPAITHTPGDLVHTCICSIISNRPPKM